VDRSGNGRISDTRLERGRDVAPRGFRVVCDSVHRLARQSSRIFTDLFSGQGRAVDQLCVCVLVCHNNLTFELNDI